jgi:hypothetical protein
MGRGKLNGCRNEVRLYDYLSLADAFPDVIGYEVKGPPDVPAPVVPFYQ